MLMDTRWWRGRWVKKCVRARAYVIMIFALRNFVLSQHRPQGPAAAEYVCFHLRARLGKKKLEFIEHSSFLADIRNQRRHRGGRAGRYAARAAELRASVREDETGR